MYANHITTAVQSTLYTANIVKPNKPLVSTHTDFHIHKAERF